jgi:hypothetical protein
MANGWTPERRKKQSEAIRQWQPWNKATGPRTDEGKALASKNAFKGGHRPLIRGIAAALRDQREALKLIR